MKVSPKYIALFSILIVLIAVWILSSFFQPRGYELPKIKQVNNITKIELDRAGNSLILLLTNNRWIILPGGFYADKSAVSDMISQLKSFSLSDLVSGGEIHSYGLDESNRTGIRAFDGDKLALDFTMGRTSSTYRHTYVELPGDNNVYQAKGSFNYLFSKNIDDLKSREISSLNKDDIMEVRIIESGSVYTLDRVRTNAVAPGANSSNSTQVAHDFWKSSWSRTSPERGKVDTLIQKLTTMNAAGVSSEIAPVNAGYLRTFELKTGKESEIINIIGLEKTVPAKTKDRFYLLSVSGNPTVFKITESAGGDLLKNINEILE